MKTLPILLTLLLAAPAYAAPADAFEWVAAAPKKDIRTVRFQTSMHCENCVKKITDNLAFAKGVKDLKISLEENTVTVTYDAAKTSQETLAAIIRKLGYKAVCQQPE